MTSPPYFGLRDYGHEGQIGLEQTPDSVFGYIPRYSEYKFMNSRVAGKMRSNLSFWHLGRIFNSAPPLLNEDIVS